jgi:hypothetical protein
MPPKKTKEEAKVETPEEKTNRINTLILRKIADKFKIPHEKLVLLANSEKTSSDKYLQLYTTFFKKIFKPDGILRPVPAPDTELNLIDIIKNLFSGTIILNPDTSGKTLATIPNPTGPTGTGPTGTGPTGTGLTGTGPTGTGPTGTGLTVTGLTGTGLTVTGLTGTGPTMGDQQPVTTGLTGLTGPTMGDQQPVTTGLTGPTMGDQQPVTTGLTGPTVDEPQPVTVNTKTSTPDTGDNVVIETKFNKEKSTKYLNYNAKNQTIIMTDKPTKSL